MHDEKEFNCMILGAGASGLHAAGILHEAGHRIAVIEARDRIGGRAHSVPMSDGTVVEFGAQQIHGPTIATWDLVAKHHLTTHRLQSAKRNADSVFRDGEWQSGDSISEEAYAKLRVAFKDLPDKPGADQTSLHDALIEAGFEGPMLAAAEGRFNVLHGLNPRHISSKSAAEALRFAGLGLPNYTIVEGHSRLWELVSKPFADDIYLESPVETVTWSDDGVTVDAGDRKFKGNTAIVTFPIGVLQAGIPKFVPALPEFKQEAIEGLKMGPAIIVMAEFETAWWEKQLGPVSGFRSTNTFFHSFDALFWDRPGPHVLRAFIGRRGVENSGKPDQIRSAFFSSLMEMFPEVNLKDQLVGFYIDDWVADPWSRGAVSVGFLGSSELRHALVAPTPPLFWAGEAAHTGGNSEATHGALEAGRRAAIETLHLLRPVKVTTPDDRLNWREFVPYFDDE